jgi:hypothetical protein
MEYSACVNGFLVLSADIYIVILEIYVANYSTYASTEEASWNVRLVSEPRVDQSRSLMASATLGNLRSGTMLAPFLAICLTAAKIMVTTDRTAD